jgi:HAE1 family hydrophobic/amphiphilic exporter-1
VLGTAATYFREGGDEFRILVRLREADRRSADQLGSLPIITPKGDRITLADVSSISRREGPLVIRRLNQERIVTVNAGYAGADLGTVVQGVRQRLETITRPEGFTVGLGGEVAEQRKTFGELLVGLLLALALVYMVMASLFESLLHPLVMLLSIPFAVIGVVLALLLTDTTLNVNSFLGMIVLVGIVVNNAIVLVDYINLLRRRDGQELIEAVVEAGRRRLRPILMTTFTTVLALMPVAIGIGEGSELQAPLGRVVVGGLLTSTLITLFFVPTLYVALERLRGQKRAAAQA